MYQIKNNLFLKFLNFFFICFPLAILSGPFLADLTVTLTCIIFLTYLIYTNRISYLFNKFFIVFLIFSLYLIFTSIISKYPLLSLQSSLFYFRFTIFVFAMAYLIENYRDALKYFTISLSFAFVIGLLYGYIYHFGEFNIILFNSSSPRIPLPFTDEFILGSYFARLFPLFFCLRTSTRLP